MTYPLPGPGGGGSGPTVAGNPGGIVGEQPGAGQPGWYGLKFANGIAAIVYWGPNGWQWGSLKRPPSNLPYTLTYLGSDRQHVLGYPPAIHRFNAFIASLSTGK